MRENLINKADQYFKSNIKKILEDGARDENPRPKYKYLSLSLSDGVAKLIRKNITAIIPIKSNIG